MDGTDHKRHGGTLLQNPGQVHDDPEPSRYSCSSPNSKITPDSVACQNGGGVSCSEQRASVWTELATFQRKLFCIHRTPDLPPRLFPRRARQLGSERQLTKSATSRDDAVRPELQSEAKRVLVQGPNGDPSPSNVPGFCSRMSFETSISCAAW
jgi:hypothetical protein